MSWSIDIEDDGVEVAVSSLLLHAARVRLRVRPVAIRATA
jgi:hypothetical protein